MRGFAAIGLVRPKTPANIGSVLRAAGCYGAGLVVIEGARGHSACRTALTDTAKAWRHLPITLAADVFDGHPVGSIPIAIDLVPGAVSLVDFVHPINAFYVFGPEDGTLGLRHTGRCMMSVQIPTAYCMNLAATVNVVLYDRMAKAARRG